MKKQNKIFVLLVMVVLLSACSKESNVQNQTETILKSGIESVDSSQNILKLGVINYPPYEVVDNGLFSGPGIEIVKEAFTRMGYSDTDYEFIEQPWVRILELIKSGELDIVVDVAKNEERLTYIDYSKEFYAQYRKRFYVLNNSAVVYNGNFESIKEYSIGVVNGYAISPIYEEAKESGMYNFDGAFTFEENIEKLLNGRIDILLDNEYAVLSYLSSKNMESEVVALEPALDETVTYLGFSKKANLIDLREKYDVVISEMRADGTIDAILARYFE